MFLLQGVIGRGCWWRAGGQSQLQGSAGAEFTEFLSQIGFLYKWAPAPCSPVSELLGYSQRGSSLLLLWIQIGRALIGLAEKSVWVARSATKEVLPRVLLGHPPQARPCLPCIEAHVTHCSCHCGGTSEEDPLCLGTHPLPHRVRGQDSLLFVLDSSDSCFLSRA